MGPLADQKICLDTTALIDVLRDDPVAVGRVQRLMDEGWDLQTTSINAFELYLGAFLTGLAKRIPQVEEILVELKILNFSSREAKESGRLLAELQRRGEGVEIRDALIAGTMLSNACLTVLTRNLEHFKRFKQLRILTY